MLPHVATSPNDPSAHPPAASALLPTAAAVHGAPGCSAASPARPSRSHNATFHRLWVEQHVEDCQTMLKKAARGGGGLQRKQMINLIEPRLLCSSTAQSACWPHECKNSCMGSICTAALSCAQCW